jgi:cation transport ATPase
MAKISPVSADAPESVTHASTDRISDMDNALKTAEETSPSDDGHSLAERIATFKHVLKIDAMLFVGIVFLSLLGVGITDYRGESAHSYWRYMLIAMALMTTLWGVWRAGRLGLAEGGKLLFRQIILWGATLAAMSVIYLLLSTGRLNYETTGLLILLVLAFATFVDGMLVSWKLYVVGGLLLFTLLMATYVEQYLWMIVITAVVLIVLVLLFVVWKIRSYSGE